MVRWARIVLVDAVYALLLVGFFVRHPDSYAKGVVLVLCIIAANIAIWRYYSPSRKRRQGLGPSALRAVAWFLVLFAVPAALFTEIGEDEVLGVLAAGVWASICLLLAGQGEDLFIRVWFPLIFGILLVGGIPWTSYLVLYKEHSPIVLIVTAPIYAFLAYGCLRQFRVAYETHYRDKESERASADKDVAP